MPGKLPTKGQVSGSMTPDAPAPVDAARGRPVLEPLVPLAKDYDLHEMQGAALFGQGKPAEAAASLETALRIRPNSVKASVLLAGCRASLGDLPGATSALSTCADLNRNNPEALVEIGDSLVRLGAMEQALHTFEIVEKTQPNDARTLFKIARSLQMLHRSEEARRRYEQVLRIRADIGPAHANLGAIYAESSEYEAARSSYAQAIRLQGNQAAGAEFRRALLMPVIADSSEEIREVRERIRREIQDLKIKRFRLKDPNMEVGTANFYLAYQGLPNRALQESIARSYISACSALAWQAPTLSKGSDRIKIGVCSAFFYEHTISRVTLGLLEKLDRSRFEVTLLRSGLPADEMAHRINRAADHVVQLAGTLETSRQTIAGLNLDVLFFTDVGMDAFTYFLSFARLAPVQCIGWGHPDTTGVPNADYYLSSETFEPEDGESHYSERLVRLPRIYVHMPRPDDMTKPLGKEALGFEADSHLYLCGQTLFKVHPDFDQALAGILQTDRKARIVFFEGSEPNWIALLKRRFERTIGADAERIVFSPRMPSDQFRAALSASDAVIDTKHFTGGHTAYLSFAAGVPVVTSKGELMRGRMSHGLYRQMGIEGLAASSDQEFVDTAVRLANDRPYRESIRSLVRERSERLFNDAESIRHLEDFFESACAAARTGKKVQGQGAGWVTDPD